MATGLELGYRRDGVLDVLRIVGLEQINFNGGFFGQPIAHGDAILDAVLIGREGDTVGVSGLAGVDARREN